MKYARDWICSSVGSNAFAVTGAASASTFSGARFLGDEDFRDFTDVDLTFAFAFLILPDAAASALLFLATIKFLPELRFSALARRCNPSTSGKEREKNPRAFVYAIARIHNNLWQ